LINVKPMPSLKTKPLTKEVAQRILRRVPYQEGFRFSRGIGDYTGQVAMSLADFGEMLQTVDFKSIDFHMGRKDFENWVRNIFGDEELAESISRRRVFQGENLRKELMTLTMQRVTDLSNMLKTA
jgi:hypothetical protein